MSEGKMIYKQISKVMADVEAIAKSSRNQQQGFMFRGIDAIYNELHGHLSKHGVFTTTEVLESTREEKQTKNGGTMTYTIAKIRFRFHTEDGSFVENILLGEGADSGDKSSNKAMAIAHKYAFLQVFAIPTAEEKDPDTQSHEVAAKSAPTPINRPNPLAPPAKTGKPSEAQLRRLFAIGNQFFWNTKDIKSYLSEVYHIDSSKDLSLLQYEEFCKVMETEQPPSARENFDNFERGNGG